MSDIPLTTIVESLLFVSDKPVTLQELADVLEGHELSAIREAVLQVKQDYDTQQRGMRIAELAGGFQMVTPVECADWLRRMYRHAFADRLSLPALETLSIVAYRQPISRPEIEAVRGVNVDGVIRTLLDKRMIRIAGRKEAPGRPVLYGTTKEFLDYFGLGSLSDLPKLEDIAVDPMKASQHRREGLDAAGGEAAGGEPLTAEAGASAADGTQTQMGQAEPVAQAEQSEEAEQVEQAGAAHGNQVAEH